MRIVTDKNEVAKITANTKAGNITNSGSVTPGISTTKTIIGEALNVLDRTNANGGKREENSMVKADGTLLRGEPGADKSVSMNGTEVKTTSIQVPDVTGNTSIHSHPTAVLTMQDGSSGGSTATETGPADPAIYGKFSSNVIVGNLGSPTIQTDALGKQTTIMPGQGAVFYDNKATPLGEVSKNALQKIVKTPYYEESNLMHIHIVSMFTFIWPRAK